MGVETGSQLELCCVTLMSYLTSAIFTSSHFGALFTHYIFACRVAAQCYSFQPHHNPSIHLQTPEGLRYLLITLIHFNEMSGVMKPEL